METTEKQTKEQLILLAAEHEFLEKGYDGARTTSIAESSGVTHAMLHYYFRTKEHLFERILNDKISLMADSMIEAMGDPELPVLERLRQGISRHFDFIKSNPQLPRFIINEVVPYPERLKVMRGNISRLVGTLFVQLQTDLNAAASRGETESIDVRTLLLDMLSLNIMPFLVYPVVEVVYGDFAADHESFLEMRKAEAIETIMRRITKRN